MPAIRSGGADAMLGGFLNVEGVDLRLRGKNPTVIPVDKLGIPTDAELVLVANSDRLEDQKQNIRLFIAALERGTKAAAADPAAATEAVLDAAEGLSPKFTAAEVRKTLPLLLPKGNGQPYGHMDPEEWQRFAQFFADHGLIEALPSTGDVLTNDLLPGNQVPAAERSRRRASAWPRELRRALVALSGRPGGDPLVEGGQDQGAGEAAIGRVRGEELLHLAHGGAAAEPGQSAHQLDEVEVAGGQRVRLAATVEAQALDRPGADLADRQQAPVAGGVGGIDPALGNLPRGADQGQRPGRRQVHRGELGRGASGDQLRRRHVP